MSLKELLPKHKIQILNDNKESKGFLNAESKHIEITYDDGSVKDMHVDFVKKRNYDAVCVLPYFVDELGTVHIYLRSCLRPALSFREYPDSLIEEPELTHNQWELPAGLIEKGEDHLTSGARELEEEVGISIDPKELRMLGHRTFTSTGMSSERTFYVYVKVDPKTKDRPSEDGSPMEYGGKVISPNIHEISNSIANGEIIDGKTVIAIERFKKLYNV